MQKNVYRWWLLGGTAESVSKCVVPSVSLTVELPNCCDSQSDAFREVSKNSAAEITCGGGYRFALVRDLKSDGLHWYKFAVTPEKERKNSDRVVQRITVRITMPRDQARYVHFPYNTWNVCTKVISSDAGWRWNHGFVPQVWLGCEFGGLAFVAETDEAWRLEDSQQAYAIETLEETVELRINLVSRSTRIAEESLFEFGIMKTPVRETPEHLRDLHVAHWGVSRTLDAHPSVYLPRPDLDRLAAAGTNLLILHSMWAKGFSLTLPADGFDLKRFVGDAHQRGIKVLLYFCMFGISRDDPRYLDQRHAWQCAPGWKWPRENRKGMPGGQYCESVCVKHDGLAEFWRRSVDELFDMYPVDGLYIDNSIPYPCENASHGCGYDGPSRPNPLDSPEAIDPNTFELFSVDKRADRCTTYPLLATRAMFRDLRRIVKKHNPDGVIYFHTSNNLLAPLLPYVDVCLNGEHYRGCESYDQIDRDSLRIQMSSAWGPLMAFLPEIQKAPAEHTYPLTLAHGALVHARCDNSNSSAVERVARLWSALDAFDVAESRFYGYWDPDCPCRCNTPEILVSAYKHRRSNAVMIVICNPTPKPLMADIHLDRQVNTENTSILLDDRQQSDSLMLNGRILSCDMPGWSVTLVRVEFADAHNKCVVNAPHFEGGLRTSDNGRRSIETDILRSLS